MAMRKIKETRVGPHCAVRIYRDPEWGEYIVKTVINGRVEGGKHGGAFETTKADARMTAAAEIRRLRRSQRCPR